MFPPLLLLAQLAQIGSTSEYSNDFILQFSDWLTNDDIDKIAAQNGLINKEIGSKKIEFRSVTSRNLRPKMYGHFWVSAGIFLDPD